MNIQTKDLIFFLGGSDAEMKEIEKILKGKNCSYFDRGLSWNNARASVYKEELSSLSHGQIPVLIELFADLELPNNTIYIDHHNERENEPSSIEQIAELLGIKLDRWQLLVGANDSRYIPGMRAKCATEDEVEQIRKYDRMSQGITQEDEVLADKSVGEQMELRENMAIVFSLTDRFSPVADRIYAKRPNLLVFNDNHLTFYGALKKEVSESFDHLLKGGQAYQGGGDTGFWGIKKGSLNTNEILNVKEEIIKLVEERTMQEKIYSYHVFMFPFKWRDPDKVKVDPGHRFRIESFDGLIGKDNWENVKFDLKKRDNYNELNYFYDYVREAIYDLQLNAESKQAGTKVKEGSTIFRHYEYRIKGQKYYIRMCDNDRTTYELNIESIVLNIYKTGTGILSFHLRNHKHADKSDVLKINKFGRKLYVPFFDLEADSIHTGKEDATEKWKVLNSTKTSELPDAIWIGGENDGSSKNELFEDFEKYKDPETHI